MESNCELSLLVIPYSSRNKMQVLKDGTIKVWVQAPPEGGAANLAVCNLIAKALNIPKSKVFVTKGQKSRTKVVAVIGSDLETTIRLLTEEVS